MFRAYDRLTDGCAAVAAWLFVAAGGMLGFEVTARYLFTAPTIWAQELSQMALVWGTFLAAAALLRTRSHIQITAVVDRLSRDWRRGTDLLSLGIVAALGLTVAVFGGSTALDSLERGRTAGTMLDLPSWVLEASVPVGFALLALQAIVEIVRLLRGEAAATPADDVKLMH